jgi:hypothetical protein
MKMTVELEQYENRVIVFIDILGFREQVKQTTTDPRHFINLRNTLNFISDLKSHNDKTEKELGREITVFSDSIVISYPVEMLGSVFWLLLDVVHIQLDMMQKGILMRGGITFGQLCHNDNIVFGPAMVDAYDLESKVAIYPRVVVNEKLFQLAGEHSHNSPEEEVKSVLELCKKDWDGQWYVDFLRQHQEVNTEQQYLEAIKIIKGVIESEIEKNQAKPSIKMKYQWLQRYFNEVVSELLPDFLEELEVQ